MASAQATMRARSEPASLPSSEFFERRHDVRFGLSEPQRVLALQRGDTLDGMSTTNGLRGCFDNAVIESFWSRMQVELLDRKQWRTRVELANAIFEYLEIFHNRQRRHSALGMLTPVEF